MVTSFLGWYGDTSDCLVGGGDIDVQHSVAFVFFIQMVLFHSLHHW